MCAATHMLHPRMRCRGHHGICAGRAAATPTACTPLILVSHNKTHTTQNVAHIHTHTCTMKMTSKATLSADIPNLAGEPVMTERSPRAAALRPTCCVSSTAATTVLLLPACVRTRQECASISRATHHMCGCGMSRRARCTRQESARHIVGTHHHSIINTSSQCH